MTPLIFFGSSVYSNIILTALLNLPQFPIVAVVTKPEKNVTNPVSLLAHQNQLNLIPTNDFNDSFTTQLSQLHPQLGLCVAFGPPFFDQTMLDLFPLGIINIHPSALPLYRGATPGPWQILNGETKSAVTFFKIDLLPDHGPIIKQIPFDITPTDTSESFYQKAFNLAAENLNTTLNSYLLHPGELKAQNHLHKTYFPKLKKEDGKVNWSWPVSKIEAFIRAMFPWPTAWTYVTNQQKQKLKMKIYSATIKGNTLQLEKVQIEGKKTTLWSEISRYYFLSD